MKNRIKGALILLPFSLALYTGSILLYLLAFVLTVLGLKEFYESFKQKNMFASYCLGVGFSICLLLQNSLKLPQVTVNIAICLLFIASAILVILQRLNIVDMAITLLGIIYVAIPLQLIIKIYEMETYGVQLAILIFILAFSTDIFAYLIGKKFGKRKLIPKVSPNKTVEGSVGAIICTTIITTIYCFIVGFNPLWFIPVAILGSICSQLGDLFASAIKRHNGIKDFGNLIPGHGGVLDRFDSILFVSIFMFLITYFME